MVLTERELRRTDFRPGPSIRLADGQLWTFPAPAGPDDEPCPGHEAMIRAVGEAEDEAERSLAELVLAIALLERNYALAPEGFAWLLARPAGDPRLARMRGDFRDLARAHAAAPCPQSPLPRDPEPARRRGRVPLTSWGGIIGRLRRWAALPGSCRPVGVA